MKYDNRNQRLILQWHITHRCNLRCAHCYQTDYSAFETKEELYRILDQFEELLREYSFSGHINLTGGEPLAHPELFPLINEVRRRGITAAVLTNGTLIGRREALRLKACDLDYVQVSLDGTKKIHDRIRGEGSFEQAVNGIRELIAQKVYTSVSFTAQSGNSKSLPELARFCRDIGVNKVWFDRVVIPSGEDDNSLSLSTSDFVKLSRRAAKLNKKNLVSCARALQFIPCDNKCIYRCTAGESLITVLADGSVMPCRRLPIISGNVRDSDLMTVYRDSPEFVNLRNSPVPTKCSSCDYAELCSGGAKCITYARFGRYDLPDPDCPILLNQKN